MRKILLLLLMLGCSTEPAIEIGVAVELSGFGSFSGERIVRGAELALEEINNQGGIHGVPLKLVIEDTRTSPSEAAKVFHKISSQNIPVVISGWTAQSSATAPIAESTETVLISASGGGEGGGSLGRFVFRTWPVDAREAAAAAKYMHNHGAKKAAVVYTQGVWEEGIRKGFVDAFPGTIVGQYTQTDRVDWRTVIARIKEQAPEAIYLAIDGNAIPSFLRQAKEVNLPAQIIGTSWTDDPAIVKSSGDALEGVMCSQYAEPSIAFVASYSKKYDIEPATPADVAYDTIHILAKVMSDHGTTADAIRSGLADVEHHGASGIISFDKHGDRMSRPISVHQFVNGTPVKLAEDL